MRQLNRSLVDAALDLGEAASNSVVTIANRLPILAAHLVRPDAAGLAEWQGAASEKVQAGWDGAVAAWSAWQEAMWSSLTVPLTPAGYALQAVKVMRVAAHPAHVQVRANAARLSLR